VVAAATSGATVEFRDGFSRASIPSVAFGLQQIRYFAARPLLVVIAPADKFGNAQDYVKAADDEFRLDVSFGNVLQLETTEPTRQPSLDGVTFFYESELSFSTAGSYFLEVKLRNSATGNAWISVTGIISATVLPGLPSAETSVISKESFRVASVGTRGSFRLRLVDVAGNDVGDGLAQASLVATNITTGAVEGDKDTTSRRADPARGARPMMLIKCLLRSHRDDSTSKTLLENPYKSTKP
jgi:hypothetical protein